LRRQIEQLQVMALAGSSSSTVALTAPQWQLLVKVIRRPPEG
jgi:hypothetical protein